MKNNSICFSKKLIGLILLGVIFILGIILYIKSSEPWGYRTKAAETRLGSYCTTKYENGKQVLSDSCCRNRPEISCMSGVVLAYSINCKLKTAKLCLLGCDQGSGLCKGKKDIPLSVTKGVKKPTGFNKTPTSTPKSTPTAKPTLLPTMAVNSIQVFENRVDSPWASLKFGVTYDFGHINYYYLDINANVQDDQYCKTDVDDDGVIEFSGPTPTLIEIDRGLKLSVELQERSATVQIPSFNESKLTLNVLEGSSISVFNNLKITINKYENYGTQNQQLYFLKSYCLMKK